MHKKHVLYYIFLWKRNAIEEHSNIYERGSQINYERLFILKLTKPLLLYH